MKYIKNITLSAFLVFTSFGVLATPGLGVITITTDDPVTFKKFTEKHFGMKIKMPECLKILLGCLIKLKRLLLECIQVN